MDVDQMPNLLKPQFNTGNILPEIESMLQRFDYKGLTDQDDPINRIVLDIMRDNFSRVMFGKPYTNIYHFKVEGRQFYLCDRTMYTRVETRQHMCLLAAGKSFPLGFEITNDDYFINNDCDTVDTMGEWHIRLERPDEYEGNKSFLVSILPHCERFSTPSNPVSFFSFPQDRILGYHVSGRPIAPDEADSAISLLQRIP
jgi:hypothetical protein